MTDYIGLAYAKNDIDLSGPIGLGVVYDENQTRQWCEKLNKCSLCWKQN